MWHNIEQNTPEWDFLRCGRFNASTLKKLFPTRGDKKGYYDEIYRVAWERMTGKKVEAGYKSQSMENGHELEPFARERYELDNFREVSPGGFFSPDDDFKDWLGASPDGLIGTTGLLEIKCPKYNTIMGYLIKDELPNEYFYQVHTQLYCSGREWNDFYVFHPNFPKQFLKRVYRDEAVIKSIQDKLTEAIKQVENIITRLK